MATSQRLSRGFHRLALFLAAIPMLIGVAASIFLAKEQADNKAKDNEQRLCAYKYVNESRFEVKNKAGTQRTMTFDEVRAFLQNEKSSPDAGIDIHGWFGLDNDRLNLKAIRCSDYEYDTVSLGEVRESPHAFSWIANFALNLSFGIGLTLVVSLAVYGVVRAIGWVIGGFAAS